MDGSSILIDDCRIGDAMRPALRSASLRLSRGEAWAVVGPSGGGKEALALALSGGLPVVPNEGGAYRNDLAGAAAVVSFGAAAALSAEERRDDDSDFVEGGLSEGRTVRDYLAARLPVREAALFPGGVGLEAHPAVVACGIADGASAGAGFLDRGLKRLSTGECRRVLLCRALSSGPALIVVSEPYEGLDAPSRERLRGTLESLAEASARGDPGTPALVVVDALERVPSAVGLVVEVSGGAVTYAGSRAAYESSRAAFARLPAAPASPSSPAMPAAPYRPRGPSSGAPGLVEPGEAPLVELRDVTVSWSGRAVLDRLSWTVRRGEHWLVRGPNGSGKTTLLELVTGDNPQAYREDVSVFGRRRGSGQSVWELKSRIGIVSYRLHLEYRYLDESPLEDVVVSGFRDSIGLYAEASDGERAAARAWLGLAGFAGRGRERFGRLSFGEQRALLVARAAVKSPELLVLDEPCHGLDEDQRRFVLSVLDAVAERGGSTMLHVTHDPDEVRPFCRRVLELRPGSSPSWAVIDA